MKWLQRDLPSGGCSRRGDLGAVGSWEGAGAVGFGSNTRHLPWPWLKAELLLLEPGHWATLISQDWLNTQKYL